MKIRKALALLFAFALVAAACGDDDEPAATAAPVVVTSIVEVPGETVTVTSIVTQTSIVEVEVTQPPPPVDPKADWPQTLVFGFVPSQEVEELQDDVETFANVLSEALGIRVVGVVTTDYTGLGVAMGTGQADLGAFGPAGYVLANRAFDNLELLAQSVRFGDQTYHGQWFTNDASLCGAGGTREGTFYYDETGTVVPLPAGETPQLQVGWDFGDDGLFRNEEFSAPTACAEPVDISVVAGKTVAFTTETSTSGFIFPTLELRRKGITDDQYTAIFSGGHDASVTAVYDGSADIGVSFNDARRAVRREKTDVGEKVIVFNITSRVANDVIAVRSDLPASLKEALFTAMSDFIQTDEGQVVMDALYSWTDLIRASDVTAQSLVAISDAIDELGFSD
jgi:phosphonate transport system substrate-binding protein